MARSNRVLGFLDHLTFEFLDLSALDADEMIVVFLFDFVACDGDAMLELGLRYENAWLGFHGQGVTHLDKMIERTGGKRLLFGTDWPFYHLAASLAKVLIVTESAERSEIRHAILRGNAEQLLG